jgi:hypothetical protein
MFSGAIRREVSASRSSATFLPEKSRPRDCASAAGLVAAVAVLLACLRAVCWRPRALPPAFAALLRDELRELPPLLFDEDDLLREPVPPLRDEDEDEADLLRELLPPLLREDDEDDLLREPVPPPLLRDDEPRDELRDDPPEELRDDPPRDDPLDDDPPDRDDPPLTPLLELRSDSAISVSSSTPRYARDYVTLKRASTGA